MKQYITGIGSIDARTEPWKLTSFVFPSFVLPPILEFPINISGITTTYLFDWWLRYSSASDIYFSPDGSKMYRFSLGGEVKPGVHLGDKYSKIECSLDGGEVWSVTNDTSMPIHYLEVLTWNAAHLSYINADGSVMWASTLEEYGNYADFYRITNSGQIATYYESINESEINDTWYRIVRSCYNFDAPAMDLKTLQSFRFQTDHWERSMNEGSSWISIDNLPETARSTDKLLSNYNGDTIIYESFWREGYYNKAYADLWISVNHATSWSQVMSDYGIQVIWMDQAGRKIWVRELVVGSGYPVHIYRIDLTINE